MDGMRWRAALLAAAVAGCSAGASAPPTSAPPSTPTTTAIRPAPTTTLPSTSTSNDATPVRLRISVGIDGSYPGGSLSHVEVFRFFPESDAFPVPVLLANTLGDPDVADTEVDRGTYEVRTYQRPCAGSCAVLEPDARRAGRARVRPDADRLLEPARHPGRRRGRRVGGGRRPGLTAPAIGRHRK